ncbi:hypothetical protein ALTERO38_60305 [Alteromonas sp. 38]|nr:hypothetical protein ALTER154_40488 [Alteromonas sp. 154]VXC17114.1 hypothetical protein ALTERO38_60305 [Alteromonas sp. 38]
MLFILLTLVLTVYTLHSIRTFAKDKLLIYLAPVPITVRTE